MTYNIKEHKKIERQARLMAWMATKSSSKKGLIDKICRFILNKATAVKPEDDFMRDALIDNDLGFDPDELERYQRGEESSGT